MDGSNVPEKVKNLFGDAQSGRFDLENVDWECVAKALEVYAGNETGVLLDVLRTKLGEPTYKGDRFRSMRGH